MCFSNWNDNTIVRVNLLQIFLPLISRKSGGVKAKQRNKKTQGVVDQRAWLGNSGTGSPNGYGHC